MRYALFIIALLATQPLLAQQAQAPAAKPAAAKPAKAHVHKHSAHKAAQAAQPDVWTRRVSRVVSIADTTDLSNRKLRPEGDDRPLAEILIRAAMDGKVKAYSNYDSHFGKMLTPAEVKKMMAPQRDTMVLEDPVTGKEVVKIISRDVNYGTIVKFRVLEEWRYDRVNGSTAIRTVAIAPVKDIYGDDGTYRGSASMMWIKYTEAEPILEAYGQTHPQKNLATAIWDDYLGDAK